MLSCPGVAAVYFTYFTSFAIFHLLYVQPISTVFLYSYIYIKRLSKLSIVKRALFVTALNLLHYTSLYFT